VHSAAAAVAAAVQRVRLPALPAAVHDEHLSDDAGAGVLRAATVHGHDRVPSAPTTASAMQPRVGDAGHVLPTERDVRAAALPASAVHAWRRVPGLLHSGRAADDDADTGHEADRLSLAVERRILLLRGINLGPSNRIAMPALRDALGVAGFKDVRTYVQSGNVVLSSGVATDTLAARCRKLIASEFGLEIAVVARTRDELAEVVSRNPLGDVAHNPKRYQVSFLSDELAPEVVERLSALTVGEERFAAIGRELYSWTPDGIARSKLWGGLAAKNLGVDATARNWTTVCTLLEMADDERDE
jgi:uncharacterized protein (DUF1697 family)